MTILVTGANGQLGNEMQIVAKCSADKYIFTDIAAEGTETSLLDITDAEAVRAIVRDNNVQVIVNCAAYTDVDAAEEYADIAERINGDAPRNLARAIKEVGGVLIHISTDYVFGKDLRNTPYTEQQPYSPTSVYGTTKANGEKAIVQTGCNHIIIRTSWLYSEFGKNFVKKMLHLTATKPTLNVVFDQTGTPTYAYDLASAILDIIENRKYINHSGIYHYSNEGVCSWYDFAKMVAEYAGNTDCDIQPCHSDEFPSRVVRPNYSVLDKTKFKQVFGIRIPYWADSLKCCLNNITRSL